MIVGIGVDVVDVPRFAATLARTPRLLPRLFAPAERVLKPRSLAARYAAKEALIKALGGSDGVHWTDIEIASEASGRPVFSLRGETATTVAARGITALHLSMSHDAGVATAYVIAEAGEIAAQPAVIPALQPASVEAGAVGESATSAPEIAREDTA
jgi:holo-[acyl-carrier protein] synthase